MKLLRQITREFIVALATSVVVTGLLLGVYESNRNDDLYRNQIAACERGNTVRNLVAGLTESQKIINHVISDFLESSATFRRAQGQYKLAAKSEAAAKKLHRLNAKIVPPQEISCVDVIEKP
jgi:hypothetical protein